MIRKLAFTLFVCGLLTCSLNLPGGIVFGAEGQCSLESGVAQPFASSPRYNIADPVARQQQTVDERLYGPSSMPAGGTGLMWSWSF